MKKTSTTQQHGPNELMRAKLELVAAREQGQPDAFRQALTNHPALADELTAFGAALIATEADPWGASDETILTETQAIAATARAQALAAIFGAPATATATAPVTAPAASVAAARSLKQLWQARGLTMQGVAQRLGLGLDVLSALEAGRIRLSSIPTRLLTALSDLLDATADQVNGALSLQLAPANLRSRQGATVGDQANGQLDFAEAINASEEMTAAQKAEWLANE